MTDDDFSVRLALALQARPPVPDPSSWGAEAALPLEPKESDERDRAQQGVIGLTVVVVIVGLLGFCSWLDPRAPRLDRHDHIERMMLEELTR